VDFAIKVNGASVAFVTFSDGRILIKPGFEHHGSYTVSITITSTAGAEIEDINMQTVFIFTVPLIELEEEVVEDVLAEGEEISAEKKASNIAKKS